MKKFLPFRAHFRESSAAIGGRSTRHPLAELVVAPAGALHFFLSTLLPGIVHLRTNVENVKATAILVPIAKAFLSAFKGMQMYEILDVKEVLRPGQIIV
jgi:hypothetical protein